MRKEKRMSEEDFIKNLSGINNGKDLDLEMLSNIYNRIKKFEYKANDDHINQVLFYDFWIKLFKDYKNIQSSSENSAGYRGVLLTLTVFGRRL